MRRFLFSTSSSSTGGYVLEEASWYDPDADEFAVKVTVAGHGGDMRVKIKVVDGIPFDITIAQPLVQPEVQVFKDAVKVVHP